MSTRQLQSLEKKISDIFQDKGKTRRQYNRSYGQIFIFHTRKNQKLLEFALADAGVQNPEAIATGIMKRIRALLKKESSYGSKSYGMQRAKEYRNLIMSNQVPGVRYNAAFHEVYAVRNYKAVDDIKRYTGKLVERYTKRYAKKTIRSGAITGQQVAGDIKNTTGVQIGHGEYGAPISLVKVLKIEQAIAKFGGSKELVEGFNTIKERFNIETSITHNMVLDNRGKFKKSWVAIISSQGARTNQLDAKEEAAFVRAAEEYFAANVLTLKASPDLVEAQEAILMGIFKKPRLKSRGTKGAKQVTSSAKVSNTRKDESLKAPVVVTGDVVSKASKVGRRSKSSKGVSSAPFALLGEFNRRLPEVLRKNMREPHLVNRTGRFADSVNVVDVQMTAQGFMSFGYTYSSDYRTFEQGNRQGSTDRDPRSLIDKSMREIAATMAIGRFYTRRL